MTRCLISLATGLTTLLLHPAASAQIQVPLNPTSMAQCDSVERQWSALYRQQQQLANRGIEERNGISYTGACAGNDRCRAAYYQRHSELGQIIGRHQAERDRIEREGKALEQSCRNLARANEQQAQQQRQIVEENQRRVQQQQALQEQQARQQQAQEQQARQQQAQEQQRRQQQALLEQQQREASFAEQQRRQQLGNQQQQQALLDQRQREAALSEQQRRQQQQQQVQQQLTQLEQQLQEAERQRRLQAGTQDRQPQQQLQPQRPQPAPALASVVPHAPTANTAPLQQRIRSSLERAVTSYDSAMQRTVQVGDTALSVGGLKDTLVGLTTTFLSQMELTSLLRGIGRGAGTALTNPVLEMFGPFLDPENGRNLFTTVDTVRRGAQGDSWSTNATRIQRELDAGAAADYGTGQPTPPRRSWYRD